MNTLFAAASIIYMLKNPKLGIYIYVAILVLIIWIVTRTSIIADKKVKQRDNGKKNEK